MRLSDNLKSIRKEHNLSQEQLAEKLGVSRQAVSKWESDQSYPEMDKVLLICKLFNYNIDELMNENVKEVNEHKQSKINFNKYIDDFFAFITKTIDMFSSMKFRQKIKCLLEQCFVIFVLSVIFVIIAAIGSSLLYNIFGSLPFRIYHIIRNFFEAIFIIFGLIAGTTIFLHIFKIRYLDYYEIVKDNVALEEENNTENSPNNKKIFIEKKKEKIIIRDPEHSQSRFLNGLMKLVLCFIKFIAICFATFFAVTFVCLITFLIISFAFIKTGLLFFGSLLCLIAALIVNYIVLELFYNFLANKKIKNNRIAISFLVALLVAGIGIGFICIGITKFNFVENADFIEDSHTLEMTDNLSINFWYNNINYIETDTDELRIVVKHSKYQDINYYIENDTLYFHYYQNQPFEIVRDFIDDINNKEIKDYYSNPYIYVYTSKTNIDKLKQNSDIKYNQEEKINDLYNDIEILEYKIDDLEAEILDKDYMIEDLQKQLNVQDTPIIE